MDCTRIQDLFTAYADRDLAPSLHNSFETHLSRCPSCRRDWQAFEHTLQLLRGLPTAPPPADLLEGIYAKLDQPNLWQRVFLRLPRLQLPIPAPAAAALATVAVLTLVVFQAMPPLSPDTASRMPQGSSKTELRVAAIPQPSAAAPDNSRTIAFPAQPVAFMRPDQYRLTVLQDMGGSQDSCFPELLIPDLPPINSYSPLCQEAQASPAFWGTRLKLVNTAQIGPPLQPDVILRLRASTPETIRLLHRHLATSKKWQTHFDQNQNLLLLLHPDQLTELQQWLEKLGLSYAARMSGPAASHTASGLLLIAIYDS